MAQADSKSGGMSAGGDAYNLEVMAEAVNYNRYLVDLVISGAAKASRVIDFGAGAGTFARSVAAAGLSVTCVEPDDHLRGILARDGLATAVDITEVPAGSADYVYTLNVLEHIEDDLAALEELFRVLRPGGRLLVYVPAFPMLFTSMDRKVGHHRRYRRKPLEERIRAAGFSVRRAAYADSLGFGAALVYRLLDPGDGSVNGVGLRLYDRYVFPQSCRLDAWLGSWLGKNVLVLAEKPDRAGDRRQREPG